MKPFEYDFPSWLVKALGTDNWVMARKSNRTSHYEAFLSPKKYFKLECQYLREGGDPEEVSPSAAKQEGWKLVWQKADNQ